MQTNHDGTSPRVGVSAIVPREGGGFPNPGLPPHQRRRADIDKGAEKRAERLVAGMFGLSILGTIVFVLAYFLVTPQGTNIFAEQGSWSALWWSNLITGLGLAVGIFFIGAAAIHWGKTLMPDDEVVEERHDIGGNPDTQAAAGAIITGGLSESGIGRRPLILTSMVAAFAVLPIAVLAPISTMGPMPGDKLFHSFWRRGLRVVRDHDGTPIRAADVAMNSIFHVMPEGLTDETPDFLEERAKAAAVLVRIDPRDGQNEESLSHGYDGILAFSKICTHVGCPVA
ncbi:MAG: ubiquinol-cytochrome C reductase, partial [Brachybacterium sp.]|nr:ubiquinol-cytochrome C reductase [Brachybacterium sp.]